jgi:hypothetical protein
MRPQASHACSKNKIGERSVAFCSDIRTNVLKWQDFGCKLEIAIKIEGGHLFRNRNVPTGGTSHSQPEFGTGEIPMDVLKMLADLRQEREQIEEAIVTLERLAEGRGRRRGRPPAWMSALKRRGRPPGSKNKSKETTAAAA